MTGCSSETAEPGGAGGGAGPETLLHPSKRGKGMPGSGVVFVLGPDSSSVSARVGRATAVVGVELLGIVADRSLSSLLPGKPRPRVAEWGKAFGGRGRSSTCDAAKKRSVLLPVLRAGLTAPSWRGVAGRIASSLNRLEGPASWNAVDGKFPGSERIPSTGPPGGWRVIGEGRGLGACRSQGRSPPKPNDVGLAELGGEALSTDPSRRAFRARSVGLDNRDGGKRCKRPGARKAVGDGGDVDNSGARTCDGDVAAPAKPSVDRTIVGEERDAEEPVNWPSDAGCSGSRTSWPSSSSHAMWLDPSARVPCIRQITRANPLQITTPHPRLQHSPILADGMSFRYEVLERLERERAFGLLCELCERIGREGLGQWDFGRIEIATDKEGLCNDISGEL